MERMMVGPRVKGLSLVSKNILVFDYKTNTNTFITSDDSV